VDLNKMKVKICTGFRVYGEMLWMLYAVKLLEFHKRKNFFEQLSYYQLLKGSASWIFVTFKRRPNVTER